MPDAPCALIIDDDQNTLGDVALRLLRLRMDLFYATELGESHRRRTLPEVFILFVGRTLETWMTFLRWSSESGAAQHAPNRLTPLPL